MGYVVDTHTHTVSSGHAYSTLLENLQWANKIGLKVLATTDHGPMMPGGPHLFHFGNMKVVPRAVNGVIHLRGCEANIIDFEGKLDVKDDYLKRLDLILASLHDACLNPGTEEENTRAVLKAMDNPYVDILGHLGNPVFPINKEAVVIKAKETGKIIEINNGSFNSRPGCEDNCLEIALLCKKYKVPVSLGSDAHICYAIGDFTKAEKILQKADMPEELIINTNKDKILMYLKNKGKLKDLYLD